jgi:hypothetical protein
VYVPVPLHASLEYHGKVQEATKQNHRKEEIKED